MTYEEAIAELKTSYCTECPVAIENNTCYENECEIFLSIESLKKQVPKKPKELNVLADVIAIGRCPICDESCSSDMKYCFRCGQSLDWSKE